MRSVESLRAFMAETERGVSPVLGSNVLVVCGGKGGVGTSLVATLLAVAAARTGEQVLLVDADDAVGSLHLLLGRVDPGLGLGGLLGGALEAEDLLFPVGEGLVLLPGGGSADAERGLTPGERRAILRRVSTLFERYSWVVVDAGSRVESVSAVCAQGAERLLCVTGADRIAVASSYAMLKVARARFGVLPVELVVNRETERSAQGVHALVRAAARSFLGTEVTLGGSVPVDAAVGSLVERGRSLAEVGDSAPAYDAALAITGRILAERGLRTSPAAEVIPLAR